MLAGINIKAQNPRQKLTPEERIENIIEKLNPELQLSADQEKEVRQIFKEFFTAIDAYIREGKRPEKSVMDNFEKERDDKLLLILSEKQMKSYMILKKDLRPQPPPQGKQL